MYAHGQDLGLRPRLNTRTDGGTSPRRLVGVSPFITTAATADFRIDISEGRSHYKGVSLTFKKQWDGKLQFLGSYTLSESTADGSLRATDEFGEYDVLDATDPFADRQENPTRTDNRHRVTISGVWTPGYGLTFAPVFRYKSAQPFNIITGTDDNRRRPQLRPARGRRDPQQRPRRGLQAARPARLEEVPSRRRAPASSSSRRASTSRTRSTPAATWPA